MSWINRELIVECLRELSDADFQRRVWLASGGEQVSSLGEAVEQLFTDSGLEDALANGVTGLGENVEEALLQLERQLSKVPRKLPVTAVIEDPSMCAVRALATKVLAELSASK